MGLGRAANHWSGFFGYTTTDDWLTEAVEVRPEGGGCKVVKSEVTDSK